MSNVKFTPISSGLVVGEAPHWQEKDQSLLFVDALNSNIYRYFSDTKRLQSLHIDGVQTVSFVIPIDGRYDEFVIGAGEALSSVTWSPSDPDVTTKKSELIVRVREDAITVRLNDGKCDPRGRLWAANRRVVLDFKASGLDGLPDGMSIDVNGHLWVACFDGWKLLEVDPEVGKVVQSFKCPSRNVTSCCFGGPDYSTLYVTSGTLRCSDEELKCNIDSGKTFALTGLQAKGKAPVHYHVDFNILDKLKTH